MGLLEVGVVCALKNKFPISELGAWDQDPGHWEAVLLKNHMQCNSSSVRVIAFFRRIFPHFSAFFPNFSAFFHFPFHRFPPPPPPRGRIEHTWTK